MVKLLPQTMGCVSRRERAPVNGAVVVAGPDGALNEVRRSEQLAVSLGRVATTAVAVVDQASSRARFGQTASFRIMAPVLRPNGLASPILTALPALASVLLEVARRKAIERSVRRRR